MRVEAPPDGVNRKVRLASLQRPALSPDEPPKAAGRSQGRGAARADLSARLMRRLRLGAGLPASSKGRPALLGRDPSAARRATHEPTTSRRRLIPDERSDCDVRPDLLTGAPAVTDS